MFGLLFFMKALLVLVVDRMRMFFFSGEGEAGLIGMPFEKMLLEAESGSFFELLSLLLILLSLIVLII